MRRIPSFDPSVQSTKMYIDVGAANVGSKMLLYNESPFNIDLDFYNGNDSILHAWEARYWTLDGETPQVGWEIDSALNVTTPPISLVMGELYGPEEKLEGSYPMALIRQASVGNTVNTVGTSQTLSNTGGAPGTNVITLSSSSNPGDTYVLTNDGLLQLFVTIAGALIQAIKTNETDPILQLGAATHLIEILGNSQVDGTETVTGLLTATAGITNNGSETIAGTLGVTGQVTATTGITNNGSETIAGTLGVTGVATLTAAPVLTAKQIQDGSANVLADWSVAGLKIIGNQVTKGNFKYQSTAGSEDWHQAAIGSSGVSYSTNSTVNHLVKVGGTGATPDNYWINSFTGVQPGSQTTSFGSVTTTTVAVTVGAALAAQAHFWKHT